MDYKMFEDLYKDKHEKHNDTENKDNLNDILDELEDFDSFEKTDGFTLEPTVLGSVDDDFDKTKEIEILTLDDVDDKKENIQNFIDNKEPLDKPVENKVNLEVSDNEVKKKERRFLPWTTDEDFHLQRAFVNCAILGFITMAFGYGTLFYILSQV